MTRNQGDGLIFVANVATRSASTAFSQASPVRAIKMAALKKEPLMNPESTPIERAKNKTTEIQQDLAVAGAELHLTNTALERELPQSERKGDVGRALQQNVAIEE